MSSDIDFEKMRLISTKPANKKKNAIKESELLTAYMSTLSNIIDFATHLRVNEMALFINSINHWINNKKKVSTRNVTVGDVVEIECGINYAGELSYRHWAIVLESSDKNILCIPTTSSEEYKKRVDGVSDGLWYYVMVGENEGFNHDCVALLNNMKNVSKKRILQIHGNMMKTKTGTMIFRNIKSRLAKYYFQKEFLEYNKEIEKLKSQIKEQKDTINGLHRTIRRYKRRLNIK